MPYKVYQRGDVWHCRVVAGRPGARSRFRGSTGTGEKARAEEFAAQKERELWDESVYGKRVVVTYAEAASGYVKRRDPGPRDRWAIERLILHFGTKRLAEVMADGGQAALDNAVQALCPTGSPATQLRSVVTPHTAILNDASKRGWCSRPNFDRPKQGGRRTDWLMPADAAVLIEAAGPNLRPLLVFLLGTGARVGEALALPWSDVDLKAGTAIFRNVPDERRTKSGKDRLVFLPPAAIVALANLRHREGEVFRRPGTKERPTGEPYAGKDGEGGGQFKSAWRGACRRAGLVSVLDEGTDRERRVPRLSPHGLRHTWATWFQAATRDPMRLRDEGGWSSVALVERYAHQMKQEDVPSIAAVWGVAHPDLFPGRRVHSVTQQTDDHRLPGAKVIGSAG